MPFSYQCFDTIENIHTSYARSAYIAATAYSTMVIRFEVCYEPVEPAKHSVHTAVDN